MNIEKVAVQHFIFATIFISLCQASYVTPLHLDSTVGDTIYLPCLDAPDEVIPIWSINGQIYSSSSISYYFNAAYRGGGLLFRDIDLNLNGTFICYKSSGDYGYQLEELITIDLNVKNTLNTMPQQNGVVNGVSLTVLSFDFLNGTKQFVWDILDRNSDNFTSRLDIIDCQNNSEILYDYETTGNNVTLPADNFAKSSSYARLIIDYSNMVEYTHLGFLFRADELVGKDVVRVYEGNKSCIPLPRRVFGYDILWPWPSPENPHRPCVCPILNRIDECHCFYKTAYILERFYEFLNGTLISLCWINLDRTKNMTKVIIREVSSIECETMQDAHSYKKMVEIIVEASEDPSTPTLYTQEEDYKICFNATFDNRAPVTHYNVSATNSVGETVLVATFQGENNCTVSTPLFFEDICGPFHFEAVAFTKFSQSTVPGYLDVGQGNSCLCIREKVRANLTVQESENVAVEVRVFLGCKSNFTHIAVLAKSLDDGCEQKVLPLMYTIQECNTTVQKQFSRFQCDIMNYKFAVIWGDINVKCNISDYTRSTRQNTEVPDTGAIIAILILLIICVVIVIIVIIIIIVYRIWKSFQY